MYYTIIILLKNDFFWISQCKGATVLMDAAAAETGHPGNYAATPVTPREPIFTNLGEDLSG